jgi:hypothetical protein
MEPDGGDAAQACIAGSVADAWLRAVIDGDDRAAWSFIDPDLRLAYAQAWILQALGRTRDDALAERLASAASPDPAWGACVRSNGAVWRSTHKVWEVYGWQVGTAPQPAGSPGLGSFARVALALNQAEVKSDPLPQQHFLMRRRDAWRIASIGQLVTRPGWPPTVVPT